MEFDEIVMKRYAAKKFDNRKIPEEKIQELLKMIRFAPSSFNVQPWKIQIIADQETKDKLLPASFNQPQVSTCSHLLVFCADVDVKTRINDLEKLFLSKGMSEEQAKSYTDMIRNGVENKESILAWAQRQLFLALSNALNGAKSLGFDSCPMEGFSSEQYSKILNLPSNLIPTALCPIGYAEDEPKPKTRFSEKQVFF